jgi:hypothetical protein
MNPHLQELSGRLFDAKREEDAAKGRRIEIEEQIAALVDAPENGSKTVDAGNGVRVTVKRGLSYKADVDAIRALDLPEEMLPLKHRPAKYELDAKAYEEVCETFPEAGKKLAEHVTTTPRKASVTLKLG